MGNLMTPAKCAQDSRREPTQPEAAHTTPMEQNNVTLEQLQLQWVMIFTFCNQKIETIEFYPTYFLGFQISPEVRCFGYVFGV